MIDRDVTLPQYIRTYLRTRGAITSETLLIYPESALSLELVGLARNGDELLVIQKQDPGRYLLNKLSHSGDTGRTAISLVPLVELTVKETTSEAMLSDPKGLDEEMRQLRRPFAIVWELIWHVAHDLLKRGNVGRVVLPAPPKNPTNAREYQRYLKLHGWSENCNGRPCVLKEETPK